MAHPCSILRGPKECWCWWEPGSVPIWERVTHPQGHFPRSPLLVPPQAVWPASGGSGQPPPSSAWQERTLPSWHRKPLREILTLSCRDLPIAGRGLRFGLQRVCVFPMQHTSEAPPACGGVPTANPYLLLRGKKMEETENCIKPNAVPTVFVLTTVIPVPRWRFYWLFRTICFSAEKTERLDWKQSPLLCPFADKQTCLRFANLVKIIKIDAILQQCLKLQKTRDSVHRDPHKRSSLSRRAGASSISPRDPCCLSDLFLPCHRGD